MLNIFARNDMDVSTDLLKELRISRSDPSPSPKRWLIVSAIILSVLLLGLLAWYFASANRFPKVRVATAVAIGNGAGNPSVLDATGYVVARRMATVSAKVTGRVREVMIEEGQRVEADAIMATLDPIDAEAERELASSLLSASRSLSGSVEAQLLQAEANAQRLDTLVRKQLVSRSQFEEAVAQRDSLRAQLIDAQRNTKVSSDRLRIADIGLSNTVVRAPFTGVIIAKSAQPGEIVSPLSAGGGFTRTGIGTIVDMDSLEIEVDVGEAFIGRVKALMPVEAVLNAYPNWKIPAEVIAIIPTADRGKATVKVRIAIKQKDARIVPDMGVRVSFLEPAAPLATPAVQHGVLIPASAISIRDGKQVAFALNDEVVRQRELKIGRSLGADREVLEGLEGGDSVVLDPNVRLTDGDRVRIEMSASDSSDSEEK